MTVLMLGKHLELGLYRAEFLRSRGHNVIFPGSKQEATAAIKSSAFDAVILSYTLSPESAVELRDLIEQNCPACPVITFTEQRWYDPKIQSDRVVLVNEGPEALLEAVESIRAHAIRRVK
jgi:DNA-binding NtrC family response regulator